MIKERIMKDIKETPYDRFLGHVRHFVYYVTFPIIITMIISMI